MSQTGMGTQSYERTAHVHVNEDVPFIKLRSRDAGSQTSQATIFNGSQFFINWSSNLIQDNSVSLHYTVNDVSALQ